MDGRDSAASRKRGKKGESAGDKPIRARAPALMNLAPKALAAKIPATKPPPTKNPAIKTADGKPPANKASEGRLVRDNLTQQLCALITDGTYKPGDHLTERELCDRLKASRPSIRETLRQLEAEGLVEIYPNRGAVVRRLSTDALSQLWEVRQVLEGLAAERFAGEGRPEQVERLDRAVRGMQSGLRSRDPKEIKAGKAAFYDALLAGANNEHLSAYIRQLNVRLSFLWSTSLLVKGRPEESIIELLALVKAIRAGNREQARAAIILYNEHAKAIGLYALRVQEEQQPAAEART